MRARPVPFPVYRKIAKEIVDLVSGPGQLVCADCYRTHELTTEEIAGYLSTGWPMHCRKTMRWITGRERQIRTNLDQPFGRSL